MKMFKKVLSVVLCVALFATLAVSGMAVSAEEITKVDGIRWFPVPAERQNDDAWEVECVKDGCLCQRFTETAEDTGNSNFLDTVWGANGELTITRNGNDATDGNYWPRIRTISLETSPELDLTVANTLYFNFDVAEGTQWNLMLSVNGINVKLSKAISDAAGQTGTVANSDADGVSGHFEGKVDLQAAFEEISKEVGTESAVNAMAIMNMGKTFVPQIGVFCVGAVGANLTLNELFISTPDDTTGANCRLVDMGLLTGLGDEYYDIPADDPVDEPVDDPVDEPVDEPVDDPVDEPNDDPADEKEEDKKDDNKKDDAAQGGDMTWLWIVLAVVAVAVVAAVVVIVMKKKNA